MSQVVGSRPDVFSCELNFYLFIYLFSYLFIYYNSLWQAHKELNHIISGPSLSLLKIVSLRSGSIVTNEGKPRCAVCVKA